jgi:hypothetical protein
MKYFIMAEVAPVIECHGNSESYLALKMESLSPVAGYPAKPVPCWRDSSARFRRFEKPTREEC